MDEIDRSPPPPICPTCGSHGFESSPIRDQCTFCDGTVGGHPPTQREIEEANRPTDKDIYEYMLQFLDFHELEEKVLAQMYQAMIYGTGFGGRGSGKSQTFFDLYGGRYEGKSFTHVIIDDPWIREPREPGEEIPEPDWKRTRFSSGPETPPSKTKRAKLRAKRKRKSK